MVIDIDSHDYFVLESMEKYFPKVINIEVSSGYTPDQYLATDDRGCSLKCYGTRGEERI